MKIVVTLLSLLLLLAQFALWFGTHGVLKLRQLEQSIQDQNQVNAQLQAQNQRLHAEVIELKQGKEALEARARSQLGLIKKGEVFYRLIPDHVPDHG